MDVAQFTHTVTPIYYDYEPLLNFVSPSADVDNMNVLMDWILEEDWKEARPPRVNILAYEASTSRQSDHPLLYKIAEERGIVWNKHIFFPFTATDYSTELTKISEDYKSDYVFMRMPPTNAAIVLKDAARMGILKEIKWVVVNFAMEPCVPGIAGVENAAGVYGLNTHAGLIIDDTPGVKFAKELHDKYHPAVPWGNMYLFGIRLAQHADLAVRVTLERVGLEGFGGGEIAESMWSGKCDSDDGFGWNGYPIKMVKGNIAIEHHGRICMWKEDGEIYPVSDWFEVPWLIGNPEVEWRL